MLSEFGTGQGFLKAGFLGFGKSGKSWTASLLACHVHKMFGSTKPIACFDTESWVEYVSPMIKAATGMNPVGQKARSLKSLMEVVRECEAGASDILIVDSITHVWREVCTSYLAQINVARDNARKSRRQKLEFQDWSALKDVWNTWTDSFLNSKLHILVCGRAGYEWSFEEVEDDFGGTKKELRKTGVKMKTEGEFAFESSLLVEMERIQVPDEKKAGKFSLVHRATVLGDRFNAMDAATCDNPTGEWFMPHLSQLVPGAVNTVDTETQTEMNVDESGDAEYQRERRQRTILAEEIQSEMMTAWPTQSAADKKAKLAALKACFDTGSWTKVEQMQSGELRNGLQILRAWIGQNKQPEGAESTAPDWNKEFESFVKR